MRSKSQRLLQQDRAALVQELERAGAAVKGNECRCPFHDDNRPSAGIFQGQDRAWRFKCQACGASGDVFDIRARLTGKPLSEILRDAGGNKRKAESAKPRMLPDIDAVRSALPGKIVSEHVYEDRNVDVVMVVFRCETRDGKKTYRVAHPVRDGWVLSAPPKPWVLYRLPGVIKADTVVLVEGERCVDVLVRYGISATTTPFGAGKAQLVDLSPLVGKYVVLWPDCDEPGYAHMRDVENEITSLDPRVRIGRIDPGALDLAEAEDVADFTAQLRTLGNSDEEIAAELLRVLSTARTRGPLDDYRQRQAAIVRGDIGCIALPWLTLTKYTRALQPARITIIAGKKGSAKSFMVLQCLLYWLGEGVSVVIIILEGSIDEYLDRALSQLDGNSNITDFDWVKDNSDEAAAATDRHAEALARLKANVTRADVNVTLEQLADLVEREAKRGRRIIAIDPISAAVRTNKPWISDQHFLNRVRATAEAFGCSILLVNHLQKGASEFSPDALAGSACYERFSDTIIQLHRHDDKTSTVKTALGPSEVTHNTTLFIEKARAPGAGLKLAYNLDAKSLKLRELGVIVKGTQKEGK